MPIQRRKRRAPLGALAAVAAVLAVAGFVVAGRMAEERDLAGATPREGVGVITEVVPGGRSRWGRAGALVTVRLGGVEHRVSVAGASPRDAGRPARVVYRVGRSGQVYIDRVEPLRRGSRDPAP